MLADAVVVDWQNDREFKLNTSAGLTASGQQTCAASSATKKYEK
jgi:uncharacterized membrane protein